jgi:hypothetical protein
MRKKWRNSMIATRSATVDTSVKWRLNPRKRIEFAHGKLYETCSDNTDEQWSQILWDRISIQFHSHAANRPKRHFYSVAGKISNLR